MRKRDAIAEYCTGFENPHLANLRYILFIFCVVLRTLLHLKLLDIAQIPGALGQGYSVSSYLRGRCRPMDVRED